MVTAPSCASKEEKGCQASRSGSESDDVNENVVRERKWPQRRRCESGQWEGIGIFKRVRIVIISDNAFAIVRNETWF